MKRYIPQTPSNDFVYPNNDKVEYDVNITHDINDNTVDGSISGLTLSFSGSNLRLQYTYTWNRNGADIWVRDSGNLGLLSVHFLAPGQEYFSAWRMIDSVSAGTATGTTYSTTIIRYLAPSYFGLTSWPVGNYSFQFRFLGLKQNFIVCDTATLAAAPTPTPSPTACGVCTSYTVTNDSSEGTATFTWNDCNGIPQETVLAPSAGVSVCACNGSIVVTQGSATVVDLGSCATPTPSPTTTGTPTPTPSATASCTYWYLVGSTQSGELLTVDYNDCSGTPQSITLGWQYPSAQTAYICAQPGSVVVVDAGIGTSATNTGTPCS